MKKLLVMLAIACQLPSAQAVTCYKLLDDKDQLVYQSPEVPLDMSRPIGAQMVGRFQGLYFMFGSQDEPCYLVDTLRIGTTSPQVSFDHLDNLASRWSSPSIGGNVIGSGPLGYSGEYGSRWSTPDSHPKPVHVSGYTRSNGTVVQSYNRARPSR